MGYIHTRKLGYYLCGVSCTADGIGIIDLTLAIVPFTVRDIETDEGAMDELLAKVGSTTSSVPVTDIAGVIVRGFDRAKIDAALRDKGLLA